MIRPPWPAGTSTGLGSLPGSDPVRAAQLVRDAAPGLPYLPELPARGLGADMVGRSASLLVDLALEWQPHGWTITSHAGSDSRVARDFLRWDLDAFTEHAQGVAVAKVQVCGPVTLAASVELTNLHKLLSDHGAFADLTASLAEGVRLHVEELRRRMPGTDIVLQLDEPSLPAALGGQIPTPSGYGTVRSLDISVARAAVTSVLAAAEDGRRVVHCCADDVPLEFMQQTGANAVSVDLAKINRKQLDKIGELIDGGMSLWLGVVPGTDAALSFDAVRANVDGVWQRLGFDRSELANVIVPTPSCGLASASLPYARKAMGLLADVGQSMLDG